MANLSGPFIVRPIATALLMIAIFLSGLLAYRLLPISSLPQVDYPMIQVVTFYPGASPEVMASAITAPLEKQFGQMPGLEQMTSNSSSTASVIALQFQLTMKLDDAEQEVQAAINAATTYLPPDLPNPPIYSKVNPADAPIITLALTSKILPLPQVEDYADTRLAPKISEQQGVGLVSLSGGQRPAVRVAMNPTALASKGLTLEAVRNAITSANLNVAKGSFDGPRLSYTINSNDQLLSSNAYRPLIVSYLNNAPVRLSDIATVTDSAENVKLAAWKNTTPAVIMNIQRQPGANVIQVADRIKHLLQSLKTSIPRAIDISFLTDRTQTIRASVKEVQFDLLFSIGLVVAVIFIFLLNFKATFIPSIAVPITLIGTFGAMYLLGFSLNNLTLMALTIAAGFVADDAIVMIENIARHIELGEKPMEAALKGAGQIGFTILSLTVSLIAVLIPLLFMSDVIGRLFREFAITLSIAILISAFVSLTLIPMLSARVLYHQSIPSLQKKLIHYYSRSLQWVLKYQGFTLIIFFITALTALALFYFIPKGFFPIQDTGLIQGISTAPESISFSAMKERQKALAKVVLSDPAVESLSSFIGIDGTNITLNSGRMLINLKPISQRDETASEVIRRLQPKLSKIYGINLYMQPIQDLAVDTRVSRTQYQYSLNSFEASEVTHWANSMTSELQRLPQLMDVTNDQFNKGLQTYIKIDRNTASRLGISTQQIDDTLYDAFGQRQISIIFTERNQYRVVLEVLPKMQQGIDALNNIYLNSSSKGPIPLSVFTTLLQKTGPIVINRQGQFPVATLSFNLAPNTALGDAIHAINKTKEKLHIPLNIQTSFEGAAKIFQNSLANEGWLMMTAVIVVYLVLGVLYESYIHPLTILSTLPSATLGALLALVITGKELSVIALIGIILLIGIVMKNAIMMIDFALEQERQHQKSAFDAIYEACLLRFRPILMTTLAALFGAIPLAVSFGMGAELRRPLGIVIIGGLIVSQLLTLYSTPVIYLAFDRLHRRIRRKKFDSPHPFPPPASRGDG